MSQAFGTDKTIVVARGEVIANGAAQVVTACAAFIAGDFVTFTLKTFVGAGELPVIVSTTTGVGFGTINAAGTTSTFYYLVQRAV